MSSSFPQAVLWDYDGTLLDTEMLWIAVEIEIMAEHQVVWTFDDGMTLVGTPQDYSTAALLSAAEAQNKPLPMSGAELYAQMHTRVTQRIEASELPWIPGVQNLLYEFLARGLPMAIVSASPLNVLRAGIERMPADAFPVVVCGDDVKQGKPDPEGYLLAASRLGIDPEQCLVLEDSIPGTLAGQAAGACVISLGQPDPAIDLPRISRLSSFTGLNLDRVTKIWCQLRGN